MTPFITGGYVIGRPYLIWLGPIKKELVPASKEIVLEYLDSEKILYNDFIYLLSKKKWIPVFQLEEFHGLDFNFHAKTPDCPSFHPPPLIPDPMQKQEEPRIDDSLQIQLQKLNDEFKDMFLHDSNKWTVLEKRLNWFDNKLSEYIGKRHISESEEKYKSKMLQLQFEQVEERSHQTFERNRELEKKNQKLLANLARIEKEIGRLKLVESEFVKAKDKADTFLEELSEVKYKIKQREGLHQDQFLKETLEKLYNEVERSIDEKIEAGSALNVKSLEKIEQFHETIIGINEGNYGRDEKLDNVLELFSKQSHLVSGLLERREALDKRIVEKVENGVNALSVEQRDLKRKIQLIIEDFKSVERAVALSSGNADEAKYVDIIRKWQDHSKELEQQISVLKSNLEKSESLDKTTSRSDINYEKVQFEKQKLEKQLQKMSHICKTQEENVSKLSNKNEQLKRKLTEIAEKYNTVVRKLKETGNSSGESEMIKLKFEEEQEKTRSMQLNLKTLQEDLEKLNSEYEDLKSTKSEIEKKAQEDQQLIDELKVYKKAQNELEKKELKRLVGDSFEVPNIETWYMKLDDIVTGPFCFGDLLEQKESGELDRKVLLKNEVDGKWKTVNEYTEFCIPVLKHSYEENGERVTKFFIKRGSFRAPFYEIVTLEFEGNEFRGYCTSLSSGGIFVELNKIDENMMVKEAIGTVSFKQGALSKAFICDVQIMNIVDKRPRGLGMMFVNLGGSDKRMIEEYVRQYLSQSQSKKAS